MTFDDLSRRDFGLLAGASVVATKAGFQAERTAFTATVVLENTRRCKPDHVLNPVSVRLIPNTQVRYLLHVVMFSAWLEVFSPGKRSVAAAPDNKALRLYREEPGSCVPVLTI